MKKMIAMILVFSMTLVLASCGGTTNSENITEDVTAEKIETGEIEMTDTDSALRFAADLFKASYQDGKNTLVSPFSVMVALAMTANGADGETLEQMEEVLGMPKDELNGYLASYIASLPEGEGYKLRPANSIWLTDDERFTVSEDFLKTNKSVYDADIFRTPFDESTKNDINSWVREKTDGMIPEILKEIPDAAIMYLVNALAFDAEWGEIYNEDQVHSAEFTREDGTKEKTELMYSEEWAYLETDNATGFLKYYKDGKYAFCAILPEEGIKMADFIDSLDGEKLCDILKSLRTETVYAAIPKFETRSSFELSGVLKGMGMPLAFDMAKADFSKLGDSDAGNIFIGRVIHETFISVAEQGTKAGAATVVEMLDGGAPFMETPKVVTLDRPFVYAIIDTETLTPVFLGTLMSTAQ